MRSGRWRLRALECGVLWVWGYVGRLEESRWIGFEKTRRRRTDESFHSRSHVLRGNACRTVLRPCCRLSYLVDEASGSEVQVKRGGRNRGNEEARNGRGPKKGGAYKERCGAILRVPGYTNWLLRSLQLPCDKAFSSHTVLPSFKGLIPCQSLHLFHLTSRVTCFMPRA